MRLGLLALLASASLIPAQTPPSYSKHVQPFFARYCLECHAGPDAEGGLSLESHKALLAGGSHGAAVEPGKPDTSRLVRMIEGKLKPAMPPKKAKQPTPAEVALVRAWVAAGARGDGAAARVTLPVIAARHKVATPVTALAYSPDGKTLAASGRGEVLLLDAATGELKSRIPAGRDRVTALRFSAKDGTLAIAASTAGEAHEVRLVRDGKATLATRHDDVIQAMAFSPDGRVLATAGYDRLLKLWDVEAGKEVRVLRDHSDSVYGLGFSPDGRLLASGGADRAVKVWDVATGSRLYTLGESTDWVYAAAWSPDGKHLAAAGVDRSIRVWEVDAMGGRVVHSVFAHEGPVTRLVYSADGKRLWSLSEDGVAKSWDTGKMVERRVYPRQPHTPLALAVQQERKEVAIGRYDGALVILDGATGKTLRQPLPLKPPAPVIEVVTPAVLTRGQTTVVTITGKHLKGTHLDSSVTSLAATVTEDTPTRRTLRVTVPPTATPGNHTLKLGNMTGEVSPAKTIVIDRFPAVAEAEPNDSPGTGQKVTLPVTVAGSIGRAGDLDWYRFEAKAGQEVGVQALTGAVGSKLEALLRLVDPAGSTVAESTTGFLGHTCVSPGVYALGVRDREFRGGSGMHYRLAIGDVPVVTSSFPLGVQRGTEVEVQVRGVHLGNVRSVKVTAPPTAAVGSRITVPLTASGEPPLGLPSLVVGEFAERDTRQSDRTLPVPGTANGAIAEPGMTETWKFTARKGQRLILEVNAARIGTPLDSTIEILDAAGKPLPRATLRCLARTFIVFRDHDSTLPGIRIETWSELAVDDWMLVGNELIRIRELPRNPDDDCHFYSEQNRRVAFLGTTPSFQSQGTPMYKVAIHPPGTTFPPNGLPVVTLPWRNDDGGPGFGKDSRLVFDPPADGTYQVRVGDARGEGSPAHGYLLTVRRPRPDFTVSFGVAGTVSKGGAVPVRVSVKRIDEFDGVVDLKALDVPAGLQAPATNVPSTDNSTAFALYADSGAQLPAKLGPMVLEARAVIDGKEVVRRATGRWPKVIEPGDIATATEQSEATIRPGGEARVTVRVQRRNKFDGRIPLEVEGLPHGVRVLDVGLNGILITPGETTRTFVLRAEPWVRPMEHPIVVLSKREGRGTDHAAKSVLLRVAK